MVCVGPHAMIPPTVHAAKYEPEKSSIFLCGFIASSLLAIVDVVLDSVVLVSFLVWCFLGAGSGMRFVACYFPKMLQQTNQSQKIRRRGMRIID